MQKRNLIFSLIVCAILSGPIFLWIANTVALPVPEFLDAQSSSYLTGGIEESNLQENLSYGGFIEKELQNSLDTEIENHIPTKEAALLGYSSLQGLAIKASNLAFGFDAYPVHFDTGRLYLPTADALTYTPLRASSYEENLAICVKDIVEAARRHPETRFTIYVVQGFQTPAVNPAYDHVTYNALTGPKTFEIATQAAGNTPENCHVITSAYESLESYYRDFFRTDHHWNINGTIRAYNDIAAELGLKSFESPNVIDFGDYRFSGATARWSLSTLDEPVFDTSYEFPYVRTLGADGSTKRISHEKFFSTPEHNRRYVFYDYYYSGVADNAVGFLNENGGNGRTCLILSNSYGGSLQVFLANEYESVLLGPPVGGWTIPDNKSLDSLLEKNTVDDIFLVASACDFADFIAHNPDFFE